MSPDDRPIVVFDALCPLCSANARFILKRDRDARFRLASIQSPVGAALCRRFGIDAADPETMIVVEDGRALRDSDAVIAILRGLGRRWRAAAAIVRLVPRSVRDPLYRLIARNRYRLFGRRDTCWIPDEACRERML